MRKRLKIVTLDNGPYLAKGSLMLLDAEGDEFRAKPGNRCAMPLRGIDEQAVLRWHPFEGRFPSGGEGGSTSGGARVMMSVTRRVAKANLPTRYGTFEMFVYGTPDHEEHVALTLGAIDDGGPVLVRAHSECLTGDVFGSSRCDCGEQLADSLRFLQEQGCGVLLYLRQEGRGIGLANKISTYALQEQGLDTVEANLALGLPEDMRDYRVAAEMLLDLGVRRARLLTNNPAKIEGLERYGVEVVERVPLGISPNPSNLTYLQTKREKMGHLFPMAVALEVARGGSA
jgi:GTP cyclohydrolase II